MKCEARNKQLDQNLAESEVLDEPLLDAGGYFASSSSSSIPAL